VGDEAPLRGGLLYNPEAAGTNAIQMTELVGPDADSPAKALVVTFFATWCKPCKREMPFLQALYTEYKDRGLRIVSVAIDRDEAATATIPALLAQHKVTYPVVKDRFHFIARQYLGDRTVLPSVFILDKDGKVVMVKQGYEKDAATFLRAEVERALR